MGAPDLGRVDNAHDAQAFRPKRESPIESLPISITDLFCGIKNRFQTRKQGFTQERPVDTVIRPGSVSFDCHDI
jgi:hypothetical protein